MSPVLLALPLLDMRGPDFLELFVWLLLGAVAWWLFLFAAARSSRQPGLDQPNLTPYETAYLAKGVRGAVEAAVVALIREGLVRVASNGTVSRLSAQVPPDVHPLEAAIMEARHSTLRQLRRKVRSATRPLHARLASQGLVLEEARQRTLTIVAQGPLWLVLALGVIKTVVGISRSRPVGFLVLLLLLGFGIAYLLRGPFLRTAQGNKALAAMRQNHTPLRTTASTHSDLVTPAEVGMAFVLFGASVVAGSEFDGLRRATTPYLTSSAGTTCSSCSSASSCGGGGGGGGCGGCGGGD